MTKLNNKAFALIEGLLVFIIVAIIGGAGYYVYRQNQNNPGDAVSDGVRVENKDTETEDKTDENPSVDDDRTLIAEAMFSYCKASQGSGNLDDIKKQNNTAMEDPHLYIRDGNHLKISSYCGGDSTGRSFLLYKDNDGWAVATAGQMGPPCAKVDGLGFPKTIVELCYSGAGSETRAPK